MGSRFATFRFTTLVESDPALPTGGASLSQLKRPFCTLCASSSFSDLHTFLLFLFYSSSFELIVIFLHMAPTKKTEKKTK